MVDTVLIEKTSECCNFCIKRAVTGDLKSHCGVRIIIVWRSYCFSVRGQVKSYELSF